MDNDQIVSRMNSYLHTSANVLAEWLGSLLPRASDDWWEECVLDKLSYNQREMAIERGFTELGQFDLAALLRIADKSWYSYDQNNKTYTAITLNWYNHFTGGLRHVYISEKSTLPRDRSDGIHPSLKLCEVDGGGADRVFGKRRHAVPRDGGERPRFAGGRDRGRV